MESLIIKEEIQPNPDRAKEVHKILRQLWGIVIVLSFLIIVLFAATINVRATQSNISTAIEASRVEALNNTLIGRENGYKSRAINCQLAVALSQPLLSSCKDPEVVKYYDPTAATTAGGNSPAQIKNRALLCALLAERKAAPEKCMDPNAPVPGFS